MKCFQHPKRKPEVILTFYDGANLTEIGLCHNCRHAAAIAAFVHEDLIPPDYEIVAIEE